MINKSEDTYIDRLHVQYLAALETANLRTLETYNLKHLLFNECYYAINTNASSLLKLMVKSLFFHISQYQCVISNQDILLFSTVFNRSDHDTYWERFKSIFDRVDSISVRNLAVSRSQLYLRGFAHKARTLVSIYRDLNCISIVKHKMYLATRILHALELKKKLVQLNASPKVFICFFDGELLANLAAQFYQKKGATTVTNQHGQQVFRSHSEDLLNQSQILNLTCDYFIARGQYEKDQFIKAGYEENRIKVLGSLNSNQDVIRKASSGEFGVFLDFPGFSFAHESNLELIRIAEKVSRITGNHYILKVHPYDNIKAYSSITTSYCVESIQNARNLADIFLEMDFGILHASSVYADIIAYGKKAFRYDSGIYFPLTEDQNNTFSSANDLVAKLSRWGNKSQAEQQAEMIAEQLYYNNTLNPREEIQNFIFKLIKG